MRIRYEFADKVKINISKESVSDEIMNSCNIFVKKCFLHLFLGEKLKLTIIILDDSTQELIVNEVMEGGNIYEKNKVTV